MYSFKEKQKHYAELRNPDTAEQDLELLRKKQPELSTLSMFSRNPKRYADDILYALLDVAERDEIRNNRRTVEQTPDPNPEQPDKVSEVTNQVEEAEERAEDAELRAEEAEERAESAEAALEEEKKKTGTHQRRKSPKARGGHQNRLGQPLGPASPNGHDPLQRPNRKLETNEAARRAAGQEPD